jgi:hypothetical protein
VQQSQHELVDRRALGAPIDVDATSLQDCRGRRGRGGSPADAVIMPLRAGVDTGSFTARPPNWCRRGR